MNFYRNRELIRGINSINMQILDDAIADLDPKWHCDSVCSSFTRIYCVMSGSGVISYDGGIIRMDKGCIYIIPSGFKFGYSCDKELKKLYFHIKLPRKDNYDYISDIKKIVELKNRGQMIDKMVSDYKCNNLFSAISLKSSLYNIMSDVFLIEENKSEELKTYSPLVMSAISYIDENLKVSLKTREIAERLYISESKLQKQFKLEVGVTPGKYIDDRILQDAETDLCNGILNLKEISEKYGFCDQFYFSRKFSEIYGISPQKYRRLMLSK